ncbi:PAAR domain-containing protein [Hymenobacter weizhouensis]|uniref:PAAR domain-containing protein n=1 Tax=Hymenobacter sp. YIM 151500-1 TaxID=2987689 RepID=UPI0029D41BF7|nr:PAAR domain-containing protein [Hymenobacter sp. YIM 151500-1]
MLDGPKPHVGGLVMPPGTPTVLIGGLPAATMGDLCMCVSPVPNSIAIGSVGVFIGGRPAARMFDKTMHGGTIMTGAPTVLIGDIAASAGPAIFPGKQNYNNCGVQASQQLIRQLTGVVHKEDELLAWAVEQKLAHNGVRAKTKEFDLNLYGRTSSHSLQALLAARQVASTIVMQPQMTDLADALKDGKGIIAGVDFGQLHYGEPNGDGHAILITDADFDGQGRLTHIYLNDTGANTAAKGQGRRVTIAEMAVAMDECKHPETEEPLAFLLVSEAPLWTSTPIDLEPARPSAPPTMHA